jgi:hypothetical protein
MTPILPRETWLKRFAAQLLVLRPHVSAQQAASAATYEYEEGCDFEPELAAAMYADEATDI